MTKEVAFFTRENIVNPALNPIFDPTAFLIRGIVSLILIVGLMLIIHKFLINRKFINTSKNFRLIDFYTLEPRKNLYLIEVCNKILVVGVTENSMNMITEIDDKDEITRLKISPFSDEKRVEFSKLIFKGKTKSDKQKKIEELKKQIERLNR